MGEGNGRMREKSPIIKSSDCEFITSKPYVIHNSGNNEWYTPKEFIDAVKDVMGGIDLDPASSDKANTVVQAAKYFTIEQDGLKQQWEGRIWLNPPYARSLLGKFSEVLIEHLKSGSVTEACVLVNNATETNWFQFLAAYTSAICFPKGRIKFWTSDRATGSPLQGQAILYIGQNTNTFISRFASLGLVVRLKHLRENTS